MAFRCQYFCALCGAPCEAPAPSSSSSNQPWPRAQPPTTTCHDQLQPRPHPHRGSQPTQHRSSRQQRRPCVCGGCGAMHYCCEAHRSRHATLPGGHSREECARMEGQVGRATELAEFPFPWFRSVGFGPASSQGPEPGAPDDEGRGTDPRVDRPGGAPVLPLCALLRSLEQSQMSGAAPPPRLSTGAGRCARPSSTEETEEAPFAAMTGLSVAAAVPRASAVAGIGAGSADGRLPGQVDDDIAPLGDGLRVVDSGGISDGGSGCTALGCWRRICECGGGGAADAAAGGPQGRHASAPGDEDGAEWGALQPPLLAEMRLPQLAPQPQPWLGQHMRAASDVRRQAARSAEPPGAAAAAPTAAAACPAAAAVIRLGGTAAGTAISAAAPATSTTSRAACRDPAAWARCVWHLPPHLAPPIVPRGGGLGGHSGGGGSSGDASCGSEGPRSVVDWLSYYRGSGLPLESPAALLLHFPLTLYSALRLVDERTGGALLSRRWDLPAAAAPVPTAAVPTAGGEEAAAEAEVQQEAGLAPRAKRRRTRSRPPSPPPAPSLLCGGAVRQEQQVQVQVQAPLPQPGAAAAKGRSGDWEQPGVEEEGEDAATKAAAAGSPGRVDVLYLGPQSELDQLDSFAVLLPLLPPGCTLRLHMVGPDVPDHLHGAVLVYDGGALAAAGVAGGSGGRGADAPLPSPMAAAVAALGRSSTETGDTGDVCHFGGNGDAVGGSAAADSAIGGNAARRDPAKEEEDLRQCGGGPAAAAPCLSRPMLLPPRLEMVLHSRLLHEAVEEGLLRLNDGDDARNVAAAAAAAAGCSGGSSCGAAAAPLLVFAPNAGLPAYLSWLPSLELLLACRQQRQKRPMGQWEAPVSAQQKATGQAPLEAAPVTGAAMTVAAAVERTAQASSRITASAAQALPAAAAGPAAATAAAVPPEPSPCCCCCVSGRRRPLACIFTAYNEEECVRSCELLEQLYGIRPDVRPRVNPFRQPLWCVSRVGNGLPSYSNGFMYGWITNTASSK